MNQEFYKNVYQSSRPRSTLKKEKQTLIIDTGETTDISSFNGRSSYNVVEEDVNSFGANKLFKFKITLDEPLLISSRSYIKLDNVTIANLNPLLQITPSTQTHTLSSHDYKVMYPGVKAPTSLLHFKVSNFNIKNVSNEIKENTSNILPEAYSIENSTLLSLRSSQKAYPQASVQVLNSNKYDILGIINPTVIKTMTFNMYWAGVDAAPITLLHDIFDSDAVSSLNRMTFEFMFEPI